MRYKNESDSHWPKSASQTAMRYRLFFSLALVPNNVLSRRDEGSDKPCAVCDRSLIVFWPSFWIRTRAARFKIISNGHYVHYLQTLFLFQLFNIIFIHKCEQLDPYCNIFHIFASNTHYNLIGFKLNFSLIPFLTQFLCQAIYVPREPRRDPSMIVGSMNIEHGICLTLPGIEPTTCSVSSTRRSH